MKNTILKAYAKLNLSLNILPERGERGFFKVKFLNTHISLFDSVRISKINHRSLQINEPTIDQEKNIAFRAAELMFETFNIPGGVSINILKNIPLRAGLGGGSSDAAAVINGLVKLYGLSLEKDQRLSLVKKIGMDMCYCITGGLCRIEGIGDVVQRLPFKLPVLNLLVATPREKKSSTAWAYSIIDKENIGINRKKLEDLIVGIKSQNIIKIASNIHNDFESPISRYYPIVQQIKTSMMKHGAMNAVLAGSGLSVFGIFENDINILKAKSSLEKDEISCFITHTIDD